MGDIQLEAVLIGDEIEEEEAKELIMEFLSETGDEITAKQHQTGDKTDAELTGYTRKSEIFWVSVAILVASDPQGVLRFLKWASDIPGLTMGITMDFGDNSRLKIFSENDFTLIDNSTEYNVEKFGTIEEHRDEDDYILVKMSEEDWIQLRSDIDTDNLEVELPPEDKIGF